MSCYFRISYISTLDTWHCKIIHAIASRSVLIEYKIIINQDLHCVYILVLNNKCMCDIIIIMFPCLLLTCEHNSIHCMWTEIAGRLGIYSIAISNNNTSL